MLDEVLNGVGWSGAELTGVTTYTILVNGEDITFSAALNSIAVQWELNRIPRATLVFRDGSASEGNFEISEEEWFVPGNEIEIQLGYNSVNQPVFKGVIISQSLKVRGSSSHSLVVECADKFLQLTTPRKSRYFYNLKPNDLFDSIVSAYPGLSLSLDGSVASEMQALEYDELAQFQVSDWDFLVDKADKLGLLCLVEDGEMRLDKPKEKEPVFTAVYGRNLIDLEVELKAEAQVKTVKLKSWDPSKGTQEEKESAIDPGEEAGNISGETLAESFNNPEYIIRYGGKLKPEMAKSIVDAKYVKQKLSKIRGLIKVSGSAVIKPGDTIVLGGVGNRFNGKVLVSGLHHSFVGGKWELDLQIGLSEKWFSEQFEMESKPLDGIGPAISGLQIGLVTKLEGDPEEAGRILVRLPIVDPSGEGIWTRLATFGAGNNRGMIIRPEIDDEVVVGFIHSDPNQPIILGTLNSGLNPAPIPSEDDNSVKGWVTRSAIKMLIDEDKPAVELEMPSGKKINIDDAENEISLKDENGNEVILDDAGIHLTSRGDIEIKAQGNVEIEGMNTQVKANATLKNEGAASAEISSSGNTVIKGGIVQIN